MKILKSNTIFEESGLRFVFDNTWVIRKYDDHTYYRGLSSAGLKAVDFIGLYQGKEAVFFEIKNYTQHSPLKAIEILNDPEPFVERMVKKVEDSLVGLRAIHGYFKRKWLYRLLYPRLIKLPLNRRNKASWVFWARLYHLSVEKQALTLVFWFDFLPLYESISKSQQQKSLKYIIGQLENRLSINGQKVLVVLNGEEGMYQKGLEGMGLQKKLGDEEVHII